MAESNVVPVGTFVEWEPNRPGKQKILGWVIAENGCHIWQGSRTAKGYAKARINGRFGYVYRHRYELEVGQIPEGMGLDHYACDNGAGGCCNPLHCRPATSRENLLRSSAMASLNRAKTHCPHGHEFSGNNLLPTLLRKGARRCRECHNNARRKYPHYPRRGKP